MTYPEEIAVEARCFAALVPNLRDTLESLKLPFETAPLECMAGLSWPRLRELCFRGPYRGQEELDLLRKLLVRAAPSLSKVCLEICPPRGGGRAKLFEPGSTPDTCFQLRSLTLAYPDPEDSIFDFVGTQLVHFSLCDFPRLYYHRSSMLVALNWAAPVLSSSECLSILKRTPLSRLTSLALVYVWDDVEDELLSYVTHALPRLSQLELHRYRKTAVEIVPYVRSSVCLLTWEFIG